MTFPVLLDEVRAKRFNPRQIAGLRLWLQADKIGGLSDGDPLETWPDSSGNGVVVTQATESKRPLLKNNQINGLPVVRGDGLDDTMVVTGLSVASGDKTFFAIVTLPITTGNKFLFDSNVGRLIISPVGSTSKLGFYDGAWKETIAATATLQYIVWRLKAAGGTQNMIFKDGASTGTTNYTARAIGGVTNLFSTQGGLAGFLACDLLEFGTYDSSIIDADLTLLHAYLSSRSGI